MARTVYNEQYVTMPMRHSIQLPTATNKGEVCFEWWYQQKWNHLKGSIEGSAQPIRLDTEPWFITEHYWGYCAQRNGKTIEYQVEHPVWQYWPATDVEFYCDVEALYGKAFVEPLTQKPSSAFVADGSVVQVRRGKKCN